MKSRNLFQINFSPLVLIDAVVTAWGRWRNGKRNCELNLSKKYVLIREQWSVSILFSFVVVVMGLVATKWGLVIMFIAYWEADITNWKERDSSVLALKESDERIFLWTAIVTATYFKSFHCNKKAILFGKVCYRSPIFYTGKIWLHFLHFNFILLKGWTSGKNNHIFWVLPPILLCLVPLVKYT